MLGGTTSLAGIFLILLIQRPLQRIGDAEEDGKGGQVRATLLSNRATTLLKLERYQDALSDTEVSLALFPKSFKALRTRARIRLHLEEFDASIADFKSAIQQVQTEGSGADVHALRSELKKAEAALKRSKSKDYYKILGVSRDCSESDIKKAYRRESLKHHPDKVSIHIHHCFSLSLFNIPGRR